MATLCFDVYKFSILPLTQPSCEVIFYYRIIDKNLIGSPEEYSETRSGDIKIGITSTLWAVWAMDRYVSDNNWIKILYEFGTRHLIQKMKEDGISAHEELLMATHNAPEKCPYDPSNILSKDDWKFEVKDIENVEEVLYMLGIVSSLITQSGQTIIVHKNWQQSNASSIEVRGLKNRNKSGEIVFQFEERNDIIRGTVLQPKGSRDFWVVTDTEDRIIDDIFDSFTAVVDKITEKTNKIDNQTRGDVTIQNDKTIGNKIFIIHGHDEELKKDVQLLLNRADLDDIVLHECPDKGRTIIDKLIEESNVACYVIALMSPDDVLANGNAMARQNVILEIGYFIGRLGKEKVRLLKKGNVEIPSDLQGILYQEYDVSGNWRIKLLKEINAVGIPVDFNKVIGKY